MATLSGYALALVSTLPIDHTYVASDDGYAWGCFGRDAGGKALASSVGDSKCANCLSDPKTIGIVPRLYAGIRYLRTGVCHQAANRLLYPAGVDVAFAGGYRWSFARFGPYGKGRWPELASCVKLVKGPSRRSLLQAGGGSRMKDDKSTQLSESVRKLYTPEIFEKLGIQNERLKIKQQELEAMAATYLGEQYDRAKVKDVVAIQISTDIEQDKLLDRLDNNDLTEADYINQLER